MTEWDWTESGAYILLWQNKLKMPEHSQYRALGGRCTSSSVLRWNIQLWARPVTAEVLKSLSRHHQWDDVSLDIISEMMSRQWGAGDLHEIIQPMAWLVVRTAVSSNRQWYAVRSVLIVVGSRSECQWVVWPGLMRAGTWLTNWNWRQVVDGFVECY